MKILITGATGFIGKRVSHMFEKKYKNDPITYLTGSDKNEGLKDIESRIKVVDLTDPKTLSGLSKKYDLIIHLAANTETSESDHRVNDIGIKNLLETLSPISKSTHFIYTSTTAVMSGRKNCKKPFDEKDKPIPTNEYGRTKLGAEKILMRQTENQNFKSTILRLPTVWGKGMRKDSFFDFLEKLIKKRSFLTSLNWPGKTSFIHVDDVAKIIVKIAEKPPEEGNYQLFILQSESPTLQQVSKLMHKKLGIEYNPINLPRGFWGIVSYLRQYVRFLEPILPASLYNYAWRASLVVDNVIYTKSNKINKIIPEWNHKKLKDYINEVL